MRIARGRLGEFGYTASSLFFPREYGIGPRGLGFLGGVGGGRWEVRGEMRFVEVEGLGWGDWGWMCVFMGFGEMVKRERKR